MGSFFCSNSYTNYTKIVWLLFFNKEEWDHFFAATVTRTTRKLFGFYSSTKKNGIIFLQQQLHELHENCLASILQQRKMGSFFCSNSYTNYTKIVWLLFFNKEKWDHFFAATVTRTTRKLFGFYSSTK